MHRGDPRDALQVALEQRRARLDVHGTDQGLPRRVRAEPVAHRADGEPGEPDDQQRDDGDAGGEELLVVAQLSASVVSDESFVAVSASAAGGPSGPQS